MGSFKNISTIEGLSNLFGVTRKPLNIVDTIGQPGGAIEFIQLSNLAIFSGDSYSLELTTLTHQYPGYWEFGLNTAPGNGSYPDDSAIDHLNAAIYVNGVQEIAGFSFVERLVIPANANVVFGVDSGTLPPTSGAYCLFTGYCYKLGF